MVCALFGFAACCQPWLQDLAPTCLGSLLSPLTALCPVNVDGRGQVAWNDRCRRLGARRQGFPQCPCRRSHLVLKFAVALLPAAEGLCVRGSPGACEDDLAQQRRVSRQAKPVAILKRFLTPPRCVGCLPPGLIELGQQIRMAPHRYRNVAAAPKGPAQDSERRRGSQQDRSRNFAHAASTTSPAIAATAAAARIIFPVRVWACRASSSRRAASTCPASCGSAAGIGASRCGPNRAARRQGR